MQSKRGNILIFLLVGLALVTAIGFGYLYRQFQASKQTETSKNQIQQPLKNTDTGVVAYRVNGASINQSGEIWTLDLSTQQKRKISPAQNIQKIYGWSPSKDKILVSVFDPIGPNTYIENLATVSVISGEVTELRKVDSGPESHYFLYSDDLVGLATSSKIELLSLKDKSVTTLVDLNSDLPLSTLSLSPDHKWVIVNALSHMASTDKKQGLYSYNLQTKKLVKLTSADQFYEWTWSTPGKVFVSFDNLGSQLINLDGSGITELAGLNGLTFFIKSNHDGNRYFYTDSTYNKLFVYDLNTNQGKEIYRDLESNISDIGNLSISADGKFGAYNHGVDNAGVFYINLDTGEIKTVCAASCYYPVWPENL